MCAAAVEEERLAGLAAVITVAKPLKFSTEARCNETDAAEQMQQRVITTSQMLNLIYPPNGCLTRARSSTVPAMRAVR